MDSFCGYGGSIPPDIIEMMKNRKPRREKRENKPEPEVLVEPPHVVEWAKKELDKIKERQGTVDAIFKDVD